MASDINEAMQKQLDIMMKGLSPEDRKRVRAAAKNFEQATDPVQHYKEYLEKEEGRTARRAANKMQDAANIIEFIGSNKNLLDAHEKLAETNPLEAKRIEELAKRQKILEVYTRDNNGVAPPRKSQDAIVKSHIKHYDNPTMRDLALVEYYLGQNKIQGTKQSLAKAAGNIRKGADGGAYDRLTNPEDKKAVSLAAYRAYDQLHETGHIGSIHGNDIQKDFQRFLDPKTPYRGNFPKDNFPGISEVMNAAEKSRMNGTGIYDGLSEDMKKRFKANGMDKPDFSRDKRYKEHITEYMDRLRASPPNPEMANEWIKKRRNEIAEFGLEGARQAYKMSQGGVPDLEILKGGDAWCRSTDANTGLPYLFKNRNQVPQCGSQELAKR